MGTCTRLNFFGTGRKSRHIREQANLNFHDFFLIKCQLWGPGGHLHVPRYFRDWTEIPTHTGTGQFYFCFLIANNELWGPDEHLHHSLIFAGSRQNQEIRPPPKPDSPRNRPISEHTLVQPRTSSSDIEWGTPFPPPHSNHIT